jgi:hypothetical protein
LANTARPTAGKSLLIFFNNFVSSDLVACASFALITLSLIKVSLEEPSFSLLALYTFGFPVVDMLFDVIVQAFLVNIGGGNSSLDKSVVDRFEAICVFLESSAILRFALLELLDTFLFEGVFWSFVESLLEWFNTAFVETVAFLRLALLESFDTFWFEAIFCDFVKSLALLRFVLFKSFNTLRAFLVMGAIVQINLSLLSFLERRWIPRSYDFMSTILAV